MTTLLVGFDSAWTRNKSGALVGVLHSDGGTFSELGSPQIANYAQAESIILKWQDEREPNATILLLDQPTIVKNASGQRPVENIVGSAVSRRYGGMQPANTSKEKMFGVGAPIWPFLSRFGGPANPLEPVVDTRVFETYPVLAIISLCWTLPDKRPAGRLPKYNPAKKNFLRSDWQHLCGLVSHAFRERELTEIVKWIEALRKTSPSKNDQDKLDACLCLLVALYLVERKNCLMVGNCQTGYIVVPYDPDLRAELDARCDKTRRVPAEWVSVFRLDQKSCVNRNPHESRPPGHDS
jgi:predicted RNase H-like nuclease